MASVQFLPILAPLDVERAVQLIQQAYGSSGVQVSAEDQRRLQQELLDIQKRPEAWGLVIPFLQHPDPNVQFFGAHTAQVKIARDWDMFPAEHAEELRDLMLQLTSHSVVAGRSKVILRKLFVSLTSLALKLAPIHPCKWPNWIESSVTFLSDQGSTTEHILDFLSIIAEDVGTADLLALALGLGCVDKAARAQMTQSLQAGTPLVVRAISASITLPHQTGSSHSDVRAALQCLKAWIPLLPGNELTSLIPLLIALLDPITTSSNEVELGDSFVAASDALQEIASESVLSNGSGSKTLTEPLLLWVEIWGKTILDETLRTASVDENSRSFCKLLVAIGDHSTSYLAQNLASLQVVSNSLFRSPALQSSPRPPQTKGHLVQCFLKHLLAYTALPGYYGADEEESEMTLGFWYLFQEALWSINYNVEDPDELEEVGDNGSLLENEQWQVAKAVYSELVSVLRRKAAWPPAEVASGWTKDQRDRFHIYRRDVGDTLINSYYVLRDQMLEYLINDAVERLATRQESDGWEEIESTLHCIKAVQEAVPLENGAYLVHLFNADILGRFPQTGHDRVRRTTLSVIGAYASWFTTQPMEPTTTGAATPLLLTAISYVVAALSEPQLCFQAANALRDLCDANRAALAPHISSFAALHAGLADIPDPEKSKVLQSISSVIQALPPDEEIPPIEAIVDPVIVKLVEAIHSSAQHPEEAKALAIVQLQTLSGVCKGLTRTQDSLLAIDDSPEELAELDRMKRTREDLRMMKVRENMFGAIRGVVDLWSTDAGVCAALSDLFKSITSLPSETTLLSLPAGPLLELVCFASQRQLTAVWLELANMLVVQLNPPSLLTIKAAPDAEAVAIISNTFPVLLQASLNFLGQPGAMEANPDIVQAFFLCMEKLIFNFLGNFYTLPPGALDALMQCAIGALALQERYSLVQACTFLGLLINRSFTHDGLGEEKMNLIQVHIKPILKALLVGFAGVAPRSTGVNLIELLYTLVTRCPAECQAWIPDILFSDGFLPSKAGRDAKEKFVKTVLGSRSSKRIREAAQQFMLVARGLEGSNFGYTSVSM